MSNTVLSTLDSIAPAKEFVATTVKEQKVHGFTEKSPYAMAAIVIMTIALPILGLGLIMVLSPLSLLPLAITAIVIGGTGLLAAAIVYIAPKVLKCFESAIKRQKIRENTKNNGIVEVNQPKKVNSKNMGPDGRAFLDALANLTFDDTEV